MYGAGMDIWGAGCILFELTTLYPLFPGSDEVDQINRIHRVLGTPSASVLSKLQKHASSQASFSFKQQRGIGLSKLLTSAKDHCLDLLTQTVEYDASKRITSRGAIQHPYFVGDMPIKSRTKVKEVKASSRRDSIATSSSIASNSKTEETTKTSSGQSTSEEQPVTKTRSMVSILLARVRFIR